MLSPSLLWYGSLIYRWLMAGAAGQLTSSGFWSGHHCAMYVVANAIVPGALVFGLVARGATIRPLLCGSLAALGVATLAASFLQFFCPMEDPAHLMVFHVLPVILLAPVGMLVGRVMLKW